MQLYCPPLIIDGGSKLETAGFLFLKSCNVIMEAIVLTIREIEISFLSLFLFFVLRKR